MYSLVVAQVGTLVVVYFIDLAEKENQAESIKTFTFLKKPRTTSFLLFRSKEQKKMRQAFRSTSPLSFKNGIEESRATGLTVAVEEMAANCAERMEGKKKFADIDIRIFADKTKQ